VEFLAYDTVTPGDLTRFPGNPNRGVVEKIMHSVARFGQYKTVQVREAEAGRPRTILAGNHTVEAYQRLLDMPEADFRQAYGPEAVRPPAELRIELIRTKDDKEAAQIVATDNRLAELAARDDKLLASLLHDLDGDTEVVGYDDDFVTELFQRTDELGDDATRFLNDQLGGDDGSDLDDDDTAFPGRPTPASGDHVVVSWLVLPGDRETIRGAIRAAQADLATGGKDGATAAVALVHICAGYKARQEASTPA